MNLRSSATALLVAMCLQFAHVAGQGSPEQWIGGFAESGSWVLVRAELRPGAGTLDPIQPPYAQRTPPRTPLTEVNITDSSARFRHLGADRDITFTGQFDGNVLSGTARSAAGSIGPFRLFRVRFPELAELRDYQGTYRFADGRILYVDPWSEPSGIPLLYAFHESGEVRGLYATDRDRFFAGPGAAFPIAVESRVTFTRDDQTGTVVSLRWAPEGEAPQIAQRLVAERREDVRFRNGDVELAGTLISPQTPGKHPAIILVHGSGAQDRHSMVPFARFLVRRGVAVLGYDKRGVGASTGDWNTASLDDFAADALAGFEYLRTRSDIEPTSIGLLGVSQASAIMPIAAVRQPQVAFLISVSSAGIPFAETDVDYNQNEMRMSGVPPEVIARRVEQTKLLYEYLRTGLGWEKFAATIPPGVTVRPDEPRWEGLRKLLFYDPSVTLQRLQVPTLAVWGELDNITMPAKNRPAWEAALQRSGNRDYTLVTLPKASHVMLEAEVGSSAEMPRLRRFVPEYAPLLHRWLATRVSGVDLPK